MKKYVYCALFLMGNLFADTAPTKIRELYNKDMSFSEFALQHQGQQISVYGFMAPPLKVESSFFVLTKQPMSVCPFCESEADWPNDILAVYSEKVANSIAYNVPIIVTGELALGGFTDPELGFFSKVRLVNASYRRK